jgi:Uma2 family endonuclease
MTSILAPLNLATPLPNHCDLPDKDGVPVRNSLEPWQSSLLSETLDPVLRKNYPMGDYFIGQDCGIYWEKTDPAMLGCKAPDWYLVLGVPRLLDGQMRRSYVLWQEMVQPFVLLEYASDDGTEERDTTPKRGKFWIYERRIRPPYFGIFLPDGPTLEMYHSVEDRFDRMKPNSDGRYRLTSLGVELGLWHGRYADYELHWLRWWDLQGNLLLTGDEKAARLAEKLKALGVDPEQV